MDKTETQEPAAGAMDSQVPEVETEIPSTQPRPEDYVESPLKAGLLLTCYAGLCKAMLDVHAQVL